MQQTITIFIMVSAAVLAALAASVGMAAAMQLTSRRAHGFIHLIFYAILISVALGSLLPGRDLTSTLNLTTETLADAPRPQALVWLQPMISLLILTVTGERIITYLITSQRKTKASGLLIAAFIFYWVATIASPALFGAHPYISHDYVYPLVIGIAVLLASDIERDLTFRAARDALFVFLMVGLLIIPFSPGLVWDIAYNQGLLPGLPRLAGLAAHPVLLGILAQLALFCLVVSPYKRRWLNRLAWGVGLLSLFLAQSKTAWISFVLCAACIVIVRGGPDFMRRAGDPVRRQFGIVATFCFMMAVLGIAALAMFGGLSVRLGNFFDSAEGAQLVSLTGRDLIWSIAESEWLRSPVFGYGPTIWDADFRAAIGMSNATSGHNQFMDTLSRSGAVGATALVLYSLVLLVMSVRYTRASGGMTLALFMALAIRSVSEVPLMLFGYGPELLTHLLLLMTLTAARASAQLNPRKSNQTQLWARPASTARFGSARISS